MTFKRGRSLSNSSGGSTSSEDDGHEQTRLLRRPPPAEEAEALQIARDLELASWLTDVEEVLRRRPPRKEESAFAEYCAAFCCWCSLVGFLFLAVVASLLWRQYPYLNMPYSHGLAVDPGLGSVSGVANSWANATFGGALIYAGIAVIAAAVYSCILGRSRDARSRPRKAD